MKKLCRCGGGRKLPAPPPLAATFFCFARFRVRSRVWQQTAVEAHE
jgi:hypothetical protein